MVIWTYIGSLIDQSKSHQNAIKNVKKPCMATRITNARRCNVVRKDIYISRSFILYMLQNLSDEYPFIYLTAFLTALSTQGLQILILSKILEKELIKPEHQY